MEPTRVSVFVDGHRYDTGTAVLLADDAYWDGSSYERDGRNRFLFRTQLRGLYFLLTRSLAGEEDDRIDPLPRRAAEALWEELPRRNVSFAEAFPESVAAPTKAPVLHVDGAIDEALRFAAGKMKTVVSLRDRPPEQKDSPSPAHEAVPAAVVQASEETVASTVPSLEAAVITAAEEPHADGGAAADAARSNTGGNGLSAAKPPDLPRARGRPQSGRSSSKAAAARVTQREAAVSATPPEDANASESSSSSADGVDDRIQAGTEADDPPAKVVDELTAEPVAASANEPTAHEESTPIPSDELPAGAPEAREADLWLDEHGEWQMRGVVRHRTGRLRLAGDELVVTTGGESGWLRKRQWTREESIPLSEVTAITIACRGPRRSLEIRVKGTSQQPMLLEDCRPESTIEELVEQLAINAPHAALQRLG